MIGARVRNLTFHGVGEPPRPLEPGDAAVWLSGPRFLAVLDALRGRDDVRVSFDDSNRSDVDVALPALLDRGMTATFFVLAGRLDEPAHLGAEDLRRLVASGMRIGSHGLLHRDWRRLDAHALTEELVASRRILEATAGTPIADASVPFGSYDRRVLARARRDGGYAHIFTSDGGTARAGAWLQPRTSITAEALPRDVVKARDGLVDVAQRSAKRLVKRWR
jgi:peptidoglycan/xylan/chitin deacetylase (PgdA/CDA1 family)